LRPLFAEDSVDFMLFAPIARTSPRRRGPGSAHRVWIALAAVFAFLTSIWHEPSRATAQETAAIVDQVESSAAAEPRLVDPTVDESLWPGRLQVYDGVSGKQRPVRRTQLTIIRNGKVRARATTDAGGVAQIKSLPAGNYSVVAVGPDGLAVFGVVIEPGQAAHDAPYRFDVLIAPAVDVRTGLQLLASTKPAKVQEIVVNGREAQAVSTHQPVLENVPDGDATTESVAPIFGDPIILLGGGRMIGQLLSFDPSTGHRLPMVGVPAVLIQDGKAVMTVVSDSNGDCNFVGLEPGYYSLFAMSAEGLVAVGLQVESERVAQEPFTLIPESPQTEFVAQLQPQPSFTITGAGPDAAPFVPGFGSPSPVPANALAPPPAPGGFGAGGGFGGAAGGGGGGFGGGGLLGALVGAGVGAAIGAAVADDDGDSDQAQQPVSPNSPPAGQ